ncbi:hypothetical protein [Tautonia sociabilis]|uniref:Uncharacterized protein n=1 Tax=Tautonia sociabilis TaxID=2080755 RepID=A0A432MC40_9BACT|nr:hypothetical protein [Tautonia sociabilis]RUL81615.1 hypothetical protein TsocGM_24935 [Tautonia sociabilis]
MTLRPTPRTRRAFAASALGLGTLALAAGCDPRALAYFLQPFEPRIEPPGPSLKGKKVVILTHATTGTTVDFPDLEEDLAKGLSRAIAAEVKKVEIVPYSRVKMWADAHPNYTDPAEAGLEFDADAVVFLEVEQIEIDNPSSPGLFQGLSRIHVKVFELTSPTDEKGKPIPGRDKEVIVSFDEVIETAFPRTQGAMPISATVNRSAFRRKFMEVVLAELSWQFIPHASGDTIQDTSF